MTEAELRLHLEDWVKTYCNDPFEGHEHEGFPGGVEIFLYQATQFYLAIADQLVNGAARSESLGDYSISLGTALDIAVGNNDIPGYIKNLLRSYRRARLL